MNSRFSRTNKFKEKEDLHQFDRNLIIERLRKVRALSCKPSDIGMDSYVDWMTKYGRAYFLIGRGY